MRNQPKKFFFSGCFRFMIVMIDVMISHDSAKGGSDTRHAQILGLFTSALVNAQPEKRGMSPGTLGPEDQHLDCQGRTEIRCGIYNFKTHMIYII
jgi:hypothetical protein